MTTDEALQHANTLTMGHTFQVYDLGWRQALAILADEIERNMRGETICVKCGLRQNPVGDDNRNLHECLRRLSYKKDKHVQEATMSQIDPLENHIINCNYCGKEQIVVHPRWSSRPHHRLRCPICTGVMVPTRWECEPEQNDEGMDEEGWIFGWMCDCTAKHRNSAE